MFETFSIKRSAHYAPTMQLSLALAVYLFFCRCRLPVELNCYS